MTEIDPFRTFVPKSVNWVDDGSGEVKSPACHSPVSVAVLAIGTSAAAEAVSDDATHRPHDGVRAIQSS